MNWVGFVLISVMWGFLVIVFVFAKSVSDERLYAAALIEMSKSYEAARNQKVCDADKIVVALSQCKKRSA